MILTKMQKILLSIWHWLQTRAAALWSLQRQIRTRLATAAKEQGSPRHSRQTTEPAATTAKPTPPPAPQTIEEFIALLQRTPRSVLSQADRARIAAVMSFDTRTVAELMVPRRQMIMVSESEVLGPLVLDRLYQSGFTHFPVVDRRGAVKGVLSTAALNTLEVKKSARAAKYLSPEVNYLHATDSLKFAVEEIERTNAQFFFVKDSGETLVGFLSVQAILSYLLGQ